MSKKIVIGKFGQAFGIRGWIKVHSFTDPTSNILNFNPWLIYDFKTKLWVEITIEKSETKGKNILVKLPDCDNPETVRRYTNLEIAIERKQLPDLPSGEFYKTDLEGLKIINTDNVELGTVQYILETGANDVLIVTNDNQQEIAIPYIKSIILEVDLAKQTITVDWEAN